MDSTVTTLRVRLSGFRAAAEAGGVSLFRTFRPALGPTKPPINGQRDPFARVERRAREDEHSPPSSAEIKNEWICTSTSRVCIHGVYRDTFTFSFHVPVLN